MVSDVRGERPAAKRADRSTAGSRPGGFSIFFQLKLLVLVVYGCVVAATAFLLPVEGTGNSLGARILILDGDLVVGRYFVISNQGKQSWHDVRVEVDDGFFYEAPLVEAGERLELFTTSFRKRVLRKRREREITKWLRAPVDIKLSKLILRTREGSVSQKILPIGEKESLWTL